MVFLVDVCLFFGGSTLLFQTLVQLNKRMEIFVHSIYDIKIWIPNGFPVFYDKLLVSVKQLMNPFLPWNVCQCVCEIFSFTLFLLILQFHFIMSSDRNASITASRR